MLESDNLITYHLTEAWITSTAAMSMNVAWKEEEPTTPQMQKLCEQVKASLEEKLGKKTIFTAINFRAVEIKIQYIAKVHFGSEECVHVKMSQSLPCYGGKVTMDGFQYPKTKGEVITPF